MTISRVYNLDAEKQVLGSIMMKNDSLCKIIDFLLPEDF